MNKKISIYLILLTSIISILLVFVFASSGLTDIERIDLKKIELKLKKPKKMNITKIKDNNGILKYEINLYEYYENGNSEVTFDFNLIFNPSITTEEYKKINISKESFDNFISREDINLDYNNTYKLKINLKKKIRENKSIEITLKSAKDSFIYTKIEIKCEKKSNQHI